MDTNEMRGKSAQELTDHIADLRREQFSLRMQKAQGQSAQTHQFAKVRREIARAATILGQKQVAQKQNGAA
ncbi:MAG: 50S ribosomal protein L29 [Xanthomonadaceae bacterium]|nr:50S ribosomal protein L29 [Xanthomonadaceae bacterium]MDE2224502.1 50S ribosomal protein L29 [Xanthomonadaceae bacterium]MDE2498149.1 50S ribosomal protein L29 [Xanthomonadaceae bacterium]